MNPVNEPEENTFLSWLKKASLEKFHQTLVNNGVTEVSHIQDVQEDDALSFGFSKFEARRLQRCFAEYKTQQKDTREIPKTAFKTSSSSMVVALPRAMRNFVETRDGTGHIVVNTESLKRKFRNLYYQSPVTPNQIFSNSFILKMAAERLQFSKSFRECENWCRKERWIRIKLMIGVTKPPTLDNGSPHHKKQSVYGCVEIAKNRYLEIVALTENDNALRKTHYEHLCFEDQNEFFNELLPRVKEAVTYITEIACNYEDLVKKSKEKYGSNQEDSVSLIDEGESGSLVVDQDNSVRLIVDEGKSGSLVVDQEDSVRLIVDEGKTGSLVVDQEDSVHSIVDEGKSGSLVVDQEDSGTAIINPGESGSFVVVDQEQSGSVNEDY
ncbi:Hypothetical predicted protein [Paramuricea clavata]|uniref:non-specific protein-tyrosine kinase n=1 Tax=Paramuricea clavata TaxID=317549 RepID=A0A6S7KYJ4_PARCT|nr:Hypothetical predicted protein [Paramuricea clavata]